MVSLRGGNRQGSIPHSPQATLRAQLLARRRELASLPDGPVAAQAQAHIEALLAALEAEERTERSERSEEQAAQILDEVLMLEAYHEGAREVSRLTASPELRDPEREEHSTR